VPWQHHENVMFSRALLRHTDPAPDCIGRRVPGAYYFAVLLACFHARPSLPIWLDATRIQFQHEPPIDVGGRCFHGV
jgi:hypothetical protein